MRARGERRRDKDRDIALELVARFVIPLPKREETVKVHRRRMYACARWVLTGARARDVFMYRREGLESLSAQSLFADQYLPASFSSSRK